MTPREKEELQARHAIMRDTVAEQSAELAKLRADLAAARAEVATVKDQLRSSENLYSARVQELEREHTLAQMQLNGVTLIIYQWRLADRTGKNEMLCRLEKAIGRDIPPRGQG